MAPGLPDLTSPTPTRLHTDVVGIMFARATNYRRDGVVIGLERECEAARQQPIDAQLQVRGGVLAGFAGSIGNRGWTGYTASPVVCRQTSPTAASALKRGAGITSAIA